MKIINLASGSNGNCTLLSVNGKNFLIDVGITYANFLKRIKEAEIYINKIDGIFITHEHSDHVSGLQSFLKNTETFCYLTRGTYTGIKFDLEKYATFGRIRVVEPLQKYIDNEVIIVTFALSHDANDPVGYIFACEDKKVAFITDTGYINKKYFKILSNMDAYFIEANHDIDMLMNSNRHWSLKQRIISDNGHLSNLQTAEVLKNIIGNKTKKIILAHLSPECNEKELALKIVLEALKEKKSQSQVIVADQIKPTPVIFI